MLATTLLVLAALGLEVRGESDCPGVDEVRARLSAIVPFSEDQRLAERAIIDRQASTIRVRLESADGNVLGERALATDASCEELAQVVAVVLAAWLGDAHPELVARLPAAANESSVEPKAPSPSASPSTPPRKASERAPRARSAEPAPRVANSSRWQKRLAVAAAVGASAGKFGWVPSATAAVSWSPANSLFGLELSLGISGERQQALGEGQVRWSRFPLTLGPRLRFASERAAFDVLVGPAVAWLRLEGSGFDETAAFSDVSYGAFGALRLGWKAGSLQPFIEAAPHLWLRRATAVAGGPSASELNLPVAELWLLVGLAVLPWGAARH